LFPSFLSYLSNTLESLTWQLSRAPKGHRSRAPGSPLAERGVRSSRLSCHVLPERSEGRIGIGGDLTASPLPHHRTFGSRIRRFGSLSLCQGVLLPLSNATLKPGRACGTTGRRILPFTTVRAFPAWPQVLCLLLTPRALSEEFPPLLVSFRGTPLPRTHTRSPVVSRTPVGA
jgi:hypothetical protein